MPCSCSTSPMAAPLGHGCRGPRADRGGTPLLYVAMTRARQHLHLVQQLRFFRTHQHRHGDGHILAMRSRFIPDSILDRFERRAHSRAGHDSAFRPELQIRVMSQPG